MVSFDPSDSISFGDELSSLERRTVIVRAFDRALGQLGLLARHFLVRDKVQKVCHAVKSSALLVFGPNDVPRSPLGIRRFEHQVPRARVLEPLAARGKVHRAEFPLAERIVDARLEAALLLLVTDLQPDFDQVDAFIHDVLLDLRTNFQKAGVIFLRAKAHHVFDARAVVPAPVEDHDFACRRRMGYVALHVHLRLLAVRRSRKGDDAEYTRADTLSDRPDGTSLAGGIAALENDNDAQSLVLDPFLEVAQSGLELAQFLLVFFIF